MLNSSHQIKIKVRPPFFLRKIFALTSLVAVFAALLFLASCKKDSTNNDPTAVSDNAIAEGESNRVIQAVNSVAYDNNIRSSEGVDSILPSCGVITIDTSNSTKSITIDFGSAPCLCSNWDGKYRQGKIIATWTGLYRDSGTVITIITQDYYQGMQSAQMNKFDYNKTVTNMGHNTTGNLHYAINVAAATITYYSGETTTWTSQRDREWIAGESTWLPFDDVYSITGSASGTDRNGNPFTVTITNPIIVAVVCAWIEKGILEITHGNLPTATLDYGDGTCDNQATITINGVTTPFTL
jgi:hypothetical protein